jgi:integrase
MIQRADILQTRGVTMQTISEKIVAALPVPQTGNKLHYFSGATLQGKKAPSGFAVRVTAAGTRSFVLFHRFNGKAYWETLGRWDANAQGGTLTVRDAIVRADRLAKDIKNGRREDPRPERTRRLQDGDKPDGLDVAGLLDLFVERYAKKLRSGDQYKSTFERLVKPEIGNIGIYEIRRSHVTGMLDEIEDESGPVMADRALAYVRKALNWYAIRDDKFLSPIVPGMRETSSKGRERILADDEIRDLWAALETLTDVRPGQNTLSAPACYPRFVKSLLLTATRRNEAANLHSAELDGDVWTIPGARYKRLPKHKDKDHVIPLSAAVRELIAEKPEGAKKNSWYVFSTTAGEKSFSGFSKAKTALDDAIAAIREKGGRAPMERWTLHDLRRTARTLMSRARIEPDHAERALGHIIGGVRGVYDKFEYLDEKRAAFEALAALVSRILNPTADVEELASRRVPA